MTTWKISRTVSSLAIAAALTLAAGVSGAQQSVPANFPKENVTIEIWWHEYGPFTAYVKELIQAYKSVRPNVTINPVVTSSGDINQKLTVALATGTGPDIMDQDASFYELYYAKGVLEPLNLEVFGARSYDDFAGRYVPGGLAAATFGGKVYALPYQGNSMSLFISDKAFEAAGLSAVKDAPKTWNDVIALGPKLKKVQGTRTVQKAFDFPYHSPRWEMQMFQPLVEQFGGKLLSDDGKTAYLNSPEAVKALTLWRDVTKATGDPKTTMNTPSNPNQDFLDGRTAMWVTGPWATSQIRQSQVKDGFTVVSYPQVNPAKPHTIVYGWMWGVNKAKPEANKIVAWDFIKFMLAKPDEWLAKVAFVQPVKGVNETAVAKNFPFYDVHMKDVATATWYIRSEYTNEIGQAAGRAIERTVYDGMDPKASLDQAQAEIDKVLKKVVGPRLGHGSAIARPAPSATKMAPASATAATARAPPWWRPRMSLTAKQAAFGIAILLPTLAILGIFRFLPMIQAFYLSLTAYDLVHPPKFVGLANFVSLLEDPLFLKSARVSLTYVLFSVVPVLPLSLGLAVLFNRSLFIKNILRSAIFMPVVMPAVVMAVVWTFMYQQDGVINTILGWFDIEPIPWLRSSASALWAVILIGIWRATPYYMVIFLAGLQAIPADYYDAAEIDGAGNWSKFWHITLPLLKPTTLLVVVMNVIVAMKVFAVPLIMTGGGPADSTRVLPLFIYQTAFEFFDMGRAAAMSVFLFVGVMLFSFVQVRMFTRGDGQR